METWTQDIENLKCGGCARTIREVVSTLDKVESVDVSTENGSITVRHMPDKELRGRVIEALRKAGYPPRGESTLRDKAVSYVSCMKGRIST